LKLDDDDLEGLVLNRVCKSKSALGQSFDRHWCSVLRYAPDVFVYLDSVLSRPKVLGNSVDTTKWLEDVALKSEQSCVFRVVKARSEEPNDAC
jgi:hypothetical protein